MFNLDDHLGELVEVYLDLKHGSDRWIIDKFHGSPSRSDEYRLNGVLGRNREMTQEVALVECQLYVHRTTWAWCRKNGRKKPHAWVIGKLAKLRDIKSKCKQRITYNPFKDESFVYYESNRRPLFSAGEVYFNIAGNERLVLASTKSGPTESYYRKYPLIPRKQSLP